jgi:hypothetical protein
LEEHGHGVEDHNEPDRPNPKADEINTAIANARDKRKGRDRAPAGPDQDPHVHLPWPKTFVTREECGRFKGECERDLDRVHRICRAAISEVIGGQAKLAAEEANVPDPIVLQGDAGKGITNVSPSN